jgi:hypothetical protein
MNSLSKFDKLTKNKLFDRFLINNIILRCSNDNIITSAISSLLTIFKNVIIIIATK